MNACLPQASYPSGNFPDTPDFKFKFKRMKESIGHAFTVCILTVALESAKYNTQKGGLNVSGEKSIQMFHATHYIKEKN